MPEHRDGPARPLTVGDTAQHHCLAQDPAGCAKSGQLDIERYRCQRIRQRLAQPGGAEDGEPRINPVIELALEPVGCGALQRGAVGRLQSRHGFQRQRPMSRQVHGTAGLQFAPAEPARGIGDRLGGAPAEFEDPILLQRRGIQLWSQGCPAVQPRKAGANGNSRRAVSTWVVSNVARSTEPPRLVATARTRKRIKSSTCNKRSGRDDGLARSSVATVRHTIQSSWRPTGGAIRTIRLGVHALDTSASA